MTIYKISPYLIYLPERIDFTSTDDLLTYISMAFDNLNPIYKCINYEFQFRFLLIVLWVNLHPYRMLNRTAAFRLPL